MSAKDMDPRTRERITLAASRVECDSHREAAILGGVVNSLISTGHLNLNYAAHTAVAAMDMARDLMHKWPVLGDRARLIPDASRPTEDELRTVCRKWRDQYEPPAGVAS